jgi:hypothetical protein
VTTLKKVLLLSFFGFIAVTSVSVGYIAVQWGSRVRAASANSIKIVLSINPSNQTNLILTSSPLASKMRIGNSLVEMQNALSVPYSSVYAWQLSPGSGQKTVYVTFNNDTASKDGWSVPVLDSVTVSGALVTPTVVLPTATPTISMPTRHIYFTYTCKGDATYQTYVLQAAGTCRLLTDFQNDANTACRSRGCLDMLGCVTTYTASPVCALPVFPTVTPTAAPPITSIPTPTVRYPTPTPTVAPPITSIPTPTVRYPTPTPTVAPPITSIPSPTVHNLSPIPTNYPSPYFTPQP